MRTCSNNGIDLMTILTSLIAKVTASGFKVLKVRNISDATESPIACSSMDDLESLLLQSIDLVDGEQVLNIFTTTFVRGEGLESAYPCGMDVNLKRTFCELFLKNAAGQVGINIANIS